MAVSIIRYFCIVGLLNYYSNALPAISENLYQSNERPAMYFPPEAGAILAGIAVPKPRGIEVLTTDTCKCGRTHSDRIVGGTEAKSGEWCWQAKIMIWSKDDDGSFFLCGGSVINEEYILSAAHCFSGKEDSKIEVYLGAYKLFGDVDGKRKFVDTVILHEDYDPITKANDIALVKLVRRIRYSDRICSICLPDKETDYTGETCTITGWGALKSGGDSPVALMEAEVKVISDETCRKQYGNLYPSQICAAAPGTDSCQGDSGGPLAHQGSDGIWDLIGVVSAGKGCADPNFAGLYTDVYKFLPWIYQHTHGSLYCSEN